MPILLIRHGNTTYDTKVDALLDPPLTEEGVERVKRTIEFLRDLKFPVARIVSSPLQRAKKVAELYSDGNIKVTTNNACAPWNLGDLMGKENSVVKTEIERLLDYPSRKAPHGESYMTFYTRWTNFLEKAQKYSEAVDPNYLVITTHSRNINALQEYIGGAPIGDVKEITPEASVTLLATTGLDDWDYNMIWDGK